MTNITEEELKILNETPSIDTNLTIDCSSAPEVGPCDAHMPMFYFDPETEQCKDFTYGGCQGNENRYETVEACEATCKIPKDEE
ncbi:Uncharacterised protein g10930 [Pycnogonum litorale]